jgi:hypothetical protein
MDRFIADGKLPNFARLRASSEIFISDAEEQEPYLEPWIQWVTVHTGVPFPSMESSVFPKGISYNKAMCGTWFRSKGAPSGFAEA